jgi:hypothetical protein
MITRALVGTPVAPLAGNVQREWIPRGGGLQAREVDAWPTAPTEIRAASANFVRRM